MLGKEVDGVQLQITHVDTELKRQNDELVIAKQDKRFLDILAIQAGKKVYNNRLPLAYSTESSHQPMESSLK